MSNIKNSSLLKMVLLAGWCLIFLRCETTAKSMIRAVYISQEQTDFRVVLLYQSPVPSSDSADAEIQLESVVANADTMEKAITQAEELLPQAANYRLCDYLLADQTVQDELFCIYENLVLRQQCGRTAARVILLDESMRELMMENDPETAWQDKLLEKLQQITMQMPCLYQWQEDCLYPMLSFAEGRIEVQEEGYLHTNGKYLKLSADQSKAVRLMQGGGGKFIFWMENGVVQIRRAICSVTLTSDLVICRLDCQTEYGMQIPTSEQQRELEQLCTRTVCVLWQQGIDLLRLQAYSRMQRGINAEIHPTKNVCPQIRTDVRFF